MTSKSTRKLVNQKKRVGDRVGCLFLGEEEAGIHSDIHTETALYSKIIASISFKLIMWYNL